MSFVPSGCITVPEALDRVGQEHFGPQWTGKEHKARADLPSEEELQRRKELVAQKTARAKPFIRPIIPGSGHGRVDSSANVVAGSLGAIMRRTSSASAEFKSLQAERDAYDRLEKARLLLRQKLEAREWKAVVVDSSNGFKRPLSDDIWRTSKAKIYIEQGKAPNSRSSGWGDLFVVEPSGAEPKPDVEPRVVGKATHVSAPADGSKRLGEAGLPEPSALVGSMAGLRQTIAAWDDIVPTGSFDPTKLPLTDEQARTSCQVREIFEASDVDRPAEPLPDATRPPKDGARPRGPRPTKRDQVEARMRQFSPGELADMKEESMALEFSASRDTCRKARETVLSGLAKREAHNTDNHRQSPTIDN